MLIGGSFSYLYFKKQGENTNVVKSGCLKISLSESSGLTLENEVPVIERIGREKTPYTVTLTNTCNTDAYFKTTLNVLDTSNRENISKTKISVSGDKTIKSLLISDLIGANLSNTPSNVVDTYLIDRGYINKGETKTYDIRLWIDYEATSYNGSLDTKVIVDFYVKGQEPIYLKSNLASSWKDKVDNELNYLALYTLNTKELPSTYTYNNETYTLTNTVDVSEQANGEVLLGEYTNSDKIIALIGQEEGVIAPLSCNNLFNGLSKVETINFLNFDTKNTTSQYRMFTNCSNLKYVNLIFDTTNFSSFGDMFTFCSSLEEIDLSKLNFLNVSSCGYMFYDCVKLKKVDFGDIPITLVSTGYMFNNCSSLETIDLKMFNTNKLTSMKFMFYHCSSLAKVEVGCDWIINENVDTTNMFSGCKVSEVEKVC